MLDYLMVFLVSMVPLAELRVAIPMAVVMKLNMPICYVLCIIGNMLPVPFIFFFARKVLEWGKDKPVIGKFFTFCLEKGHKGGQKLQAKAGRGLFWALFLFVGIPLPGTGAFAEETKGLTHLFVNPVIYEKYHENHTFLLHILNTIHMELDK